MFTNCSWQWLLSDIVSGEDVDFNCVPRDESLYNQQAVLPPRPCSALPVRVEFPVARLVRDQAVTSAVDQPEQQSTDLPVEFPMARPVRHRVVAAAVDQLEQQSTDAAASTLDNQPTSTNNTTVTASIRSGQNAFLYGANIYRGTFNFHTHQHLPESKKALNNFFFISHLFHLVNKWFHQVSDTSRYAFAA